MLAHVLLNDIGDGTVQALIGGKVSLEFMALLWLRAYVGVGRGSWLGLHAVLVAGSDHGVGARGTMRDTLGCVVTVDCDQ